MTEIKKKTEVGSYFISNYPPFSQWTAEQLPVVEQALAQPPRDVPLGLYLHIPFCRKRCKFCYFKVFTDKNAGEIERYVSALSKEIELVSQQPAMGGRPFRFVYFGGGTPSFLSARQLTSLVDRLRDNISWEQAEEVTFECEPGTLQEKKVHTLRELGVTRLSLGVENFTDEVLEENGRAHLSKQIYQAWDWIQDAAFPNVNIDLIAGMVGETWDNWKYNIEKTIELDPDSVTIYQMELPYNSVYSQDILGNRIEIPVADWPQKRAWLDYAFDELIAAGYHISSGYTLVKDKTKVNFSYRDNLWDGSDLLATGIASFGHISGVHYQNKAEWQAYCGALEQGKLPLDRAYRPSEHERLIRAVILQLKRGYLNRQKFRDQYGIDIVEHWQAVWDQYRADGFIESVDESEIRLSRQGILRVDGLLPEFFEDQHRGVRYT